VELTRSTRATTWRASSWSTDSRSARAARHLDVAREDAGAATNGVPSSTVESASRGRPLNRRARGGTMSPGERCPLGPFSLTSRDRPKRRKRDVESRTAYRAGMAPGAGRQPRSAPRPEAARAAARTRRREGARRQASGDRSDKGEKGPERGSRLWHYEAANSAMGVAGSRPSPPSRGAPGVTSNSRRRASSKSSRTPADPHWTRRPDITGVQQGQRHGRLLSSQGPLTDLSEEAKQAGWDKALSPKPADHRALRLARSHGRGQVSSVPNYGDSWNGLLQQGPVREAGRGGPTSLAELER